MIIYYGSLAYFMYIFIAISLAALLSFLLSKLPRTKQRRVLLIISLLNVAQHLLKSVIYPQYRGMGFNALSTAYNMCALLILIMPFAYLFKWKPLRDFVFLIGSAAGLGAIAVPYWHIGESAFTADVIRFIICHTLLFITSVTPLILKIHEPRFKVSFRLGIYFILGIGVIILNDILCIELGIYHGMPSGTNLEILKVANPVWSFGPPPEFSYLLDYLKPVTPSALLFSARFGGPIPILWYALPLYLGITLLSMPVLALLHPKGAKQFFFKILYLIYNPYKKNKS